MTFELSAATVVAYLRGRGLLPPGLPVEASALSGGVSNEVLSVRGPGVDLVVKQALGRLRVQEEWLASTDRVLIEAGALRLAGRLRPGTVPTVIDVDEAAMTLTIAHADRSLRNWKTELLAGRLEEATAAALGSTLAAWHNGTAGERELAARWPATAFVQLRIDPFHRFVAGRHPDLAPRLDQLTDQLLTRRRCLVHGDFSPKNVLADGARIVVLDWEVAHGGDPVFDLGFLGAHLLLKASHRPAARAGYRRLQDTFRSAYEAAVVPALRTGEQDLAGHTAALLLARVDGKSPVDYLTEPERDRVRALARRALADERPTVAHLWEQLDA